MVNVNERLKILSMNILRDLGSPEAGYWFSNLYQGLFNFLRHSKGNKYRGLLTETPKNSKCTNQRSLNLPIAFQAKKITINLPILLRSIAVPIRQQNKTITKKNNDLRNVRRLGAPYLHLQFRSSTKSSRLPYMRVTFAESETETDTHLKILSKKDVTTCVSRCKELQMGG